jgi:hypothetical protein
LLDYSNVIAFGLIFHGLSDFIEDFFENAEYKYIKIVIKIIGNALFMLAISKRVKELRLSSLNILYIFILAIYTFIIYS